MVYHDVTLGHSEGQLMSLANGEKVQLGRENMDGDCPFQLTTAQVNRIAKAYAGGKGCTLQLSAAQVKKHGMQGSGRFGDLIRAGWDMAKPLAKDLARQGVKAGVNYGANKLGDYANGKLGLQNGEGFFGNILRRGAHGLTDMAIDSTGLGAQQGHGAFD